MSVTLSNPFAAKVGGDTDNTKPTSGKQNADDIESFLNDETGEDTNDDTKDKKSKEKEDKDDDVKPGELEEDNNDDDDDKDKDEDDNDETDDEDIKLKEDEDKDDEEDEKLDLKKKDDDEVKVPPKKKEILAKYPKFFEDFPAIEKMIYRDKQYNELFGSFDNAREVAERGEQYNAFEKQLLNGEIGTVLSVVKDADPKAYDKIVDNYLTVLEKTDEKAFKEVVGNYFKRVIQGMVTEAKSEENKELFDQAKGLYKYLFNTTQWEEPKARVASEESDESKELKRKQAEFTNKKFQSAVDTLQVKVDNVLRATISDYIDPDQRMTAFEKKKAIESVLEQLHSRNDSDKQLTGNLNKLWRAAFTDDFSNASLDKIRKTYLGKSRGELNQIIKNVRNEVLKDKSPRAKKEDKEEEEKTAPRQSKTTAGRPSQQTPKGKERQKGESVEDFFARD